MLQKFHQEMTSHFGTERCITGSMAVKMLHLKYPAPTAVQPPPPNDIDAVITKIPQRCFWNTIFEGYKMKQSEFKKSGTTFERENNQSIDLCFSKNLPETVEIEYEGITFKVIHPKALLEFYKEILEEEEDLMIIEKRDAMEIKIQILTDIVNFIGIQA